MIHADLASKLSDRHVECDGDYIFGGRPDDDSTCATCLTRVTPPEPMAEHGCDGYEGLWLRWDGSYYVGYCQLCDTAMPRRTPLNTVSSVLVWHDCHVCDPELAAVRRQWDEALP